MRESRRMQSVQSPIIPVVGELIRNHPGTISLGQGVVYYGPPREAESELTAFWKDPENHKYKLVRGLAPLLDLVGLKLESENGFRLGADNALVITAGGNLAFTNALLAIADPGDEIILQTPYYFNHEMAVTMAGCQPVLVDTDSEYQLRPDAIAAAITPRTRAVVTVSPNNPTGAVYTEESLRTVNGLCRDRGIYHVHDEAYEYFTYEGAPHFSPGSIEGSAGYTISLYSLSKAYGFASWRIGYMVVPDHLLDAVKKIQDTLLICAPVISQCAAIGALKAGRAYCRKRQETIIGVRRHLLEELDRDQGAWEFPKTQGAFYFLLRLNTEKSPMELVEALVREHKVAAIPGTAFGMEQGCLLRVAYGALDAGTAAEGVGRLVRGLRRLLA
ncbi:MAG: pyridoxal phosphate-dependent aminotransferase [Verrucomicrobia bacterium]|nr:pyridoxal phosphate-dependent aminotransferase [Verrucomicrobiota bacterium]